MSYTVLARKWRPKNFSELVGQSHVMQALSNALDQNRLHHAYLFTGTRGVGKTTIARIFAKALNCEQGISSKPCDNCEICRSIDEGRFIDLIEVDAASKTKVDDTREILDNVQFAPTQGRYKVYLIDEVHMLSKSSFNALLKTLEEPPEHVKFLLATTDPHKLPITVLSRCLQFNLMRLTQTQIQNHLSHILSQENVSFEDSALGLIAKSADGSARDSLSLLDQAIAYGAGEVMFEPVQTMLGLVDQQFGVSIIEALQADDANALKSVIQQLAVMGVDYQALLSQLIESFHAITYTQMFAEHEPSTLLPAELVSQFAQSFAPERVQMLYQIALLAKQDMQLAPDIRIGFEMALMRMLAFQPADSVAVESGQDRPVAVAQVAPAPTPVVESASDEMSPQEAMASLASARSLVGKKNTEISSAPVHGNAQAVVTSEPEPAPIEEVKQFSEPAVEPAAPVQMVQPVDTQDSVQSSSEIPSKVETEQSKETVDHQDHLSQVRAKLKMPFGQSATKPEPSELVSEVASKPEIKAETLESQPVVQAKPENPAPQSMMEKLQEPSADLASEDVSIHQQPEVQQPITDGFGNDYPVEAPAEPIQAESFSQQENVQQLSEVQTGQADTGEFEATGDNIQDWNRIIEVLGLDGMAENIAKNSVLVSFSAESLLISLDPEQQFAKPEMGLEQIRAAAQTKFGQQIQLTVVESSEHFTPVKQAEINQQNQMQAAQQSIASDPYVNQFKEALGMEVIASSIKPV